MKLLSRREVADNAGISLRSLERLLEVGKGPTVVRIGQRRIGVTPQDFDLWINSMRAPSPGSGNLPKAVADRNRTLDELRCTSDRGGHSTANLNVK